MYCLLYRFRKKQYHKHRSPVAQNASMVSTRQFHIHKKIINSTAHIMLMMLRINTAAQNFSNLSCSLTYMIYEHRQWTCSFCTLNHFSSPTHILRWVVFKFYKFSLPWSYTVWLTKRNIHFCESKMSHSLFNFSSWTKHIKVTVTNFHKPG